MEEDSQPKKKLEVSRDGIGQPPRRTALAQEEPDEEPDDSAVFQGPTIFTVFLKRCFLLAKAFVQACLGRLDVQREAATIAEEHKARGRRR